MIEAPCSATTAAEPGPPPASARRPFLLAGGTLGVLFLLLQAWWVLTPTPALQSGPRVVEVPANLGVVEVARTLSEAAVIRSPAGFVLTAVVRGSARSLKAGEYEIPRGANTVTVVSLLEQGRVIQHPVLLREGGTLAELARSVEAERLVPAEELLRVARDPAFLRSQGIPGDSVEGYLFPDTYHLVKGLTPEEILGRMIARMRERLGADVAARAEARGLSVHQVLTLASIVEREAVDPKEMPLISAVFWNRLKRDMPLQADPTVQYAVGKDGRALTRADLQADSPYNTYRYGGLPPGPIGSPGKAAVEAVLNPARVGYLYFVAMNDREHRFSATLAEHNAAVQQYRQGRGR